MIRLDALKLGDKVRYKVVEFGLKDLIAEGTIIQISQNHAIMACDGSHGWDTDIHLWIDKDTAMDFTKAEK